MGFEIKKELISNHFRNLEIDKNIFDSPHIWIYYKFIIIKLTIFENIKDKTWNNSINKKILWIM